MSAALDDHLAGDGGVLLYADALPSALAEVVGRHRERTINVGIAEATLVSMSAGLASCGLRPVVVGLAPFLAGRAFSQLRQDIALNHLPVTFVGFAAGATLSAMGPSHCTLDDLGLMRLLPEIDIAVASDDVTAAWALATLLRSDRPGYLRVEGARGPARPRPGIRSGLEILRTGDDIVLAATGAIVHETLDAAEALSTEGIEAMVVEVVSLRPLDAEPLWQAHDHVPLVVVEEHRAEGGLGSALLTDPLGRPEPRRIARLTPPVADDFAIASAQIQDTTRRLIAATTLRETS